MSRRQLRIAIQRGISVVALVFISIEPVMASSHSFLPQVQAAPESCVQAAPLASPVVPAVSGDDFELWYLQRAIDGHAAAISAASIGLQRAAHSDVRRIALRVAESQAGELQLLQAWKSLWFADRDEFSAESDIADQVRYHLECTASSEFDITFLRTIISLHHAAIALAEEAALHANNLDLRSFAQSTIAARATELRLMAELVEELTQPSE